MAKEKTVWEKIDRMWCIVLLAMFTSPIWLTGLAILISRALK